MAETKLRPCPFCGGEDLRVSSYLHAKMHTIECRTCLVSSGVADSVDEAVARWNRRAGDGEERGGEK